MQSSFLCVCMCVLTHLYNCEIGEKGQFPFCLLLFVDFCCLIMQLSLVPLEKHLRVNRTNL